MKTQVIRSIKKYGFMILLLLLSNEMKSQLIYDPLRFETLKMIYGDDVKRKGTMVDIRSEHYKTLVEVTTILTNFQMFIAKTDSIIDENIVPLVDDYNTVKTLYEKADPKEFFGVAEHMLGTTLDPKEYFPDFLKNSTVSKYMDKTLGWSYSDYSQATSFYEPGSARFGKYYKKLMPSADDMRYMISLEEGGSRFNEMGNVQSGLNNSLYEYLDGLVLSNSSINYQKDSVNLSALLDSVEIMRYQIYQAEQYVIRERKVLTDYFSKKKLSLDQFALYRSKLMKTQMELAIKKDKLSQFMAQIGTIMEKNAREIHSELVIRAFMRGFDDVVEATDYYHYGGGVEMCNMLLGED